jgi:hypothetical protein
VAAVTAVLLPLGVSSPISFFRIGVGVRYLQQLADGSLRYNFLRSFS